MTIDDPRLDAVLRSYAAPLPSTQLTARVLAAAAPLLASYVPAVPNWGLVRRAVLVALLALPSALAVDAFLLQSAYRLFSVVLPHALSVALTVQYGLTLLLLLGGTFVVIPVLAGHAPARVEDAHV